MPSISIAVQNIVSTLDLKQNANFVTDITYNAKGQRDKIEYGNGTETTYTYEAETFRLTSLQTTESTNTLQYITYVYDPVGNIVKCRDDSHNKVFTTTGPVEPVQTYLYDSLCVGQTNAIFLSPDRP